MDEIVPWTCQPGCPAADLYIQNGRGAGSKWPEKREPLRHNLLLIVKGQKFGGQAITESNRFGLGIRVSAISVRSRLLAVGGPVEKCGGDHATRLQGRVRMVVVQLPGGATTRQRSPRIALPQRRIVLLVVVAVSSTKTSL